MSNQLNLRDAVISVAKSATDNVTGGYAVKWPDASFSEQPSGAIWLRVTPLYNPPIEVALNELDRIDGVLQIDVFMPKDTSNRTPYRVADELRQSLPLNGVSVNVNGVVVRFSSAGIDGNPTPVSGWSMYMFTARFSAFVNRTD